MFFWVLLVVDLKMSDVCRGDRLNDVLISSGEDALKPKDHGEAERDAEDGDGSSAKMAPHIASGHFDDQEHTLS